MENLEKSEKIQKFLFENGFGRDNMNGNLFPLESIYKTNELLNLKVNGSVFAISPCMNCGFEGNDGYAWITSENHEDCFWLAIGEHGDMNVEIPLKDIKYFGLMKSKYVGYDILDYDEIAGIKLE